MLLGRGSGTSLSTLPVVSTKLTHFLLQFADADADGSVTGLALG